MKKNNKEYEAPIFDVLEIEFTQDVLKDSQPGGGGWGYFDEDDTRPSSSVDPTDDFDW